MPISYSKCRVCSDLFVYRSDNPADADICKAMVRVHRMNHEVEEHSAIKEISKALFGSKNG